MIKIGLNGEVYSLEIDTTLDILMQSLKLGEKRVAVEVNQQIIPKSQHADYKIQPRDRIEIITAIGGG